MFNKASRVLFHLHRPDEKTPYSTAEKKTYNIPREGEKVQCSWYGAHEGRVVDVIHYPEPKGGVEPYIIVKMHVIPNMQLANTPDSLDTAKQLADNFGQEVTYELFKLREYEWVQRSRVITGHLISAFEDNRIRNVKLKK